MSDICKIRFIIVAFCCWSTILFLLYNSLDSSLTRGVATVDRAYTLSFDGAPPVIGTYALFSSVEVVYALPKTNKLSGIALLFHGCSHNALKFFSPSSTHCKRCVGLSEELKISRILLEKGYAVLAITSQNRVNGCWSAKQDMPHVRTALAEFRNLVTPQQLMPAPGVVLAIGASSGGRFAAEVAAINLADAALVMVMSLGPSLTDRLIAMGKSNTGNSSTARIPPIYLAPMPRDKGTTAAAKKDYATIAAAFIQGDVPLVLDTTTCVPFAVTMEFLNERVPLMGKDAAGMIVESLIEGGHLDPVSQILLKDPTKSNWRDVVRADCGDTCLRKQPLEQGHSPLAKALHRAWAFHEYCSEVILVAVDFFERKLAQK